MVTFGLAAMLLAVSMFFVDVKGHTRFTKPGIIFGSNAIAVYVLADVWGQFFYNIKYGGSSLNVHWMQLFENAGWNLKMGSFLFALIFVSLNFLPAWILYKKRIFIKL
jgi:predicted acyltransferase